MFDKFTMGTYNKTTISDQRVDVDLTAAVQEKALQFLR